MKPRITFLVLIIFLSLQQICFAQKILWQKTIGADQGDNLRDMIQTSDGGFLLGGLSPSNLSGDKTEGNIGYGDIWVVKINSTGSIQWDNTIGGNFADGLTRMKQTSDMGFILVGYSESNISGDKSENTFGNADAWVIKLDSLGNVKWDKTFGGSGSDYSSSVEQTKDKGYIIGGSSSSPISGNKTDSCRGSDDFWVLKLDSVGTIIWQKTIGGASVERIQAIRQTPDGGYICGGFSYSDASPEKTENSMGVDDYWIVKLDSVGNVQWQNTIGGNKSDVLLSLELTPDKGYLLGGESSSDISGDKSEVNLSLSVSVDDFWIIKLDSNGTILWQNTIGGDNTDNFSSLKLTDDGGSIITGRSYSGISGDKTEDGIAPSQSEYWVLKLDSLGNIQWQNTIQAYLDDVPFAILQTSAGGFLVGGTSNSFATADKSQNSKGTYDYWILMLSGNYNTISGKLFLDTNSNQIQDPGEIAIPQKKIAEQSSGNFAFSEQNGNYTIAVTDTGTFTVYPEPISYHTFAPSSHTNYFNTLSQAISTKDFACQPAGVFNDLCVSLTSSSAFRPGFTANYFITYTNLGTTYLTPTIILFPDATLSYGASSLTPASITQDSIVWTGITLAPFESGTIRVSLNVSNSISLGASVNSSVRIEPLAGDANPLCNYNSWSSAVTGSLDPNEIIVNRDTLYSNELINPPFLEYTINFQNTGTDTAFNVSILNPIDIHQLDLQSFEFINSSHPASITWKSWESSFIFDFKNILLVDSNENEPNSHGFLRYRIKPKNFLSPGDWFANNAWIYFDFNLPVSTDTAVTSIVLPNSVINSSSQHFETAQILPHPLLVKSELIFYNPFQELYSFTLSTIAGQIIEQKSTCSGRLIIEKGSKPPGIYFYELRNINTSEILNGKIVIGK